jgi:hypothetical protein
MNQKDKVFEPPQPPAGFPLAGLPGANQGLDPALMAQIQTIAHAAVDSALQWAFQNIVPLLLQAIQKGPQAVESVASEAAGMGDVGFNQAAAADDLMARGGAGVRQVAKPAMGPFPHGDVDLRFMGPNVAPNVRPERGGHGRQFYFLNNPDAPVQVPRKAAADAPRGGGGQAPAAARGLGVVGFKPG